MKKSSVLIALLILLLFATVAAADSESAFPTTDETENLQLSGIVISPFTEVTAKIIREKCPGPLTAKDLECPTDG